MNPTSNLRTSTASKAPARSLAVSAPGAQSGSTKNFNGVGISKRRTPKPQLQAFLPNVQHLILKLRVVFSRGVLAATSSVVDRDLTNLVQLVAMVGGLVVLVLSSFIPEVCFVLGAAK